MVAQNSGGHSGRVIPEFIPYQLKERPQWVMWRRIVRNGKPTKPLYQLEPLRKDVQGRLLDEPILASTTDSTTWGTFDFAYELYDGNGYGPSGYDGIGFVFSSGDPFAGIDLDDCRDPETGDIEPWAQEIINGFVGYKEVSPSGKGIHIIVRGKVKDALKRDEIEIYSMERYFTITGVPYDFDEEDGYVAPEFPDQQKELNALLKRYRPSKESANGGGAHRSHGTVGEIPDELIIEKAKKAKNGQKFQRLMDGDLSDYDGDHSAADEALVWILYFWTQDEDQIKRIHESSGLSRDKSTDRLDYLDRSIRNAAESGMETYDWARRNDNSANSANRFQGNEFEKPPIPLAPEAVLPEFPLAALPDIYRKTAEAACETYQVPSMLPGSLTLGVIAAAVGDRTEVVPRDGWEEPLVVWPLPLLESGETKTATFKFYQQPISDWIELMREDYRKQLWVYESKLAALDKMIEAKQKEAAKAESIVILNAADELFQQKAELKPPRSPEFIMSDTTGEGASRTAKLTGGHVALFSDEGETLKIIAGRYAKDQAPDVEFWLKAHAASPYRVRRSTREGFDLPEVTAAFVVSVQPDVILQLNGIAQLKGLGFFARLLYGLPKSNIGKRKARRAAIPADVRTGYVEAIKNILPPDFDSHNSQNKKKVRIEFSVAADAALEVQQEEIEPRLAGDLSHLRDWASKFPGAVARIAGLLHVADKGLSGKVSLETYEAAEEIGRCYLEHAQALFYRLGQDPRIEAARHVLSKLEPGTTISKRDLFEKVKGYHITQSVEQLDAALKVLADHGWVREVPQGREGPGRKPSPLIEVNPLTPEMGAQNSHNSSDSEEEEQGDKRATGDEDDPDEWVEV
jgi:hypothetical protein